jgi:ketosteroid isomerase-like protein
MQIDDTGNPVVQAAIKALNAGDRAAWFALFAPEVTLTDDGNPLDFADWSNRELFEGGGHITALDRIENDGLLLYAKFHSDQWGDFETFMKFEVVNGQISRLNVGQAD